MSQRLYELRYVEQQRRGGVGRERADGGLRRQRVRRVLPAEVRQRLHWTHAGPRDHVDELLVKKDNLPPP